MAVLLGSAALGGPPFETDDPEPTPEGHFESYLFTAGTQAAGMFSGTSAGVEVNYGAFADTQVTLALPFDFESPPGAGARFGLGDAALSVKYRFVEEDEDGWRPQIAVFPEIDLPLRSSAGKNARQFFPVWVQKSFGDWTTFGGGGYWNNPGAGNRDYWFTGWALLRKISPVFTAGVEIFHQTADTVDGTDATSVGVGAMYDLSEAFRLVGSFNTGVQNHAAGNACSYFVALEWTM
jgi:hypothetical protein